MPALQWRKKPVVVSAVEWDGSNDAWAIIQQWGRDCNRTVEWVQPGDRLIIPTLEGDHQAQVGDYIIKGVQGEIYPCRSDIFLATYERPSGDEGAGPRG